MAHTTSYFVTVETRHTFPLDDYTQIAGQLVNALNATLTDPERFKSIMHVKELTDPAVEVEASRVEEESGDSAIVCRAIVKCTSDTKAQFDKALFTTLMRSETRIPFSVTKNLVKPGEEG